MEAAYAKIAMAERRRRADILLITFYHLLHAQRNQHNTIQYTYPLIKHTKHIFSCITSSWYLVRY